MRQYYTEGQEQANGSKDAHEFVKIVNGIRNENRDPQGQIYPHAGLSPTNL